MALTETVVTIALAMITMVVSIVVGHVLGRGRGTGCLLSLLTGGLVLPVIFSIVLVQLTPYMIVLDWPTGSPFLLPPPFAIWMGGIIGGILGWKTSDLWNQDEDTSCLYCTLVPVLLVTAVSLIALLL
ncbi:MAG: hypothetical protein JSW61_05305 [Candidatus Thorarchaeota archaeon]|nr:MAG: hypothetical protein JSW61_05305 [Candidatus Thorarchaeota archaeon]